MSWRALGVVVLGLIPPPEPQGPLPPLTERPYWALVERYRKGDRGAVLREIRGKSDGLRVVERLEDLARAASKCVGSCPAQEELRALPVEAAVMLHTDRALLARERADAEGLELHLQRARRFAGVLLDLPDRRGFACRWFVGTGLWWQKANEWGQALRFFEAGVKECPQDPELPLALGTLEETLARIARPPPPEPSSKPPPLMREPTPRERLRRAERYFQRAIQADPGGMEARLRLGWVLSLLGEPDRAMLELEAAARQSRDPVVLYLSHLFRGRVAEGGGRLEEAEAAYLHAIALLPQAPTGCLALSHVLRLRGETADSMAWLQRGLAESARAVGDPWWAYPFGRCLDADERLEALRREASA